MSPEEKSPLEEQETEECLNAWIFNCAYAEEQVSSEVKNEHAKKDRDAIDKKWDQIRSDSVIRNVVVDDDGSLEAKTTSMNDSGSLLDYDYDAEENLSSSHDSVPRNEERKKIVPKEDRKRR